MRRSEDLAPLFPQPGEPDLGYRQGLITAWNPETFENTVEVGGTTLTDVPIMSSVDALTYVPGTVIGLQRVRSQYYIIGRIIIPGAGAGEDAVDWLRNSIALAVVAATYSSASVISLEGTTSTEPADLATPGPSVDVQVGESGRMVVTVSANIRPPIATSGSLAITTSAHMGFEITGATLLPAHLSGRLTLTHRDDFQAGGEGSADEMTASSQELVTGLNPGTHTVTAKYWRSGAVTNAGPADFVGRVITVQEF